MVRKKDATIAVRLEDKDKRLFEMVCEERGVSKTAGLTDAMRLWMGFTLEGWAIIQALARRLEVPVEDVLENLAIAWVARKDAEIEAGLVGEPLFEFLKRSTRSETGETEYLLIQGDTLYENVKRHELKRLKPNQGVSPDRERIRKDIAAEEGDDPDDADWTADGPIPRGAK